MTTKSPIFQTQTLVHTYLLNNFGIFIPPKLITTRDIPGTLKWEIDPSPAFDFLRDLRITVWRSNHHYIFRSALGTKVKPVLADEVLNLPGIERLGEEYCPMPELDQKIKDTDKEIRAIAHDLRLIEMWNEDAKAQIERLRLLDAGRIVRARVEVHNAGNPYLSMRQASTAQAESEKTIKATTEEKDTVMQDD